MKNHPLFLFCKGGVKLQELTFENYNKISDVMMNLGKNANLLFNMRLYSESEKFGRSYYHSEVQYYNESTNSKLVNIKRKFDSYISFEQSHPVNGEKGFVMIRNEDIRMLRKAVEDMELHIVDHFKEIYVVSKGNVHVRKVQEPLEITGLALNKYLVFTPDVVENFNGSTSAAVRVTLGNPNLYVLMNMKKWSGLIECLNNANMFLYSQNASTYIGRPAFGTNMYDMTSKQNVEDNMTAKKGRTFMKSGKRSFFED